MLLALSAVLLLSILSGTAASGLEEPDGSVNGTSSIQVSRISQPANTTAEVENNYARAAKSLMLSLVPVKHGFNTARKVDSYVGWNKNNGSTYHEVSITRDDENSTTASKAANLAYKEMLVGRRANAHRKYHYNTYQNDRVEEKNKYNYSVYEDYEQQTQLYNPDYYPLPQNAEYEDTYNTIPEDQNQSQITIADPLRVSYALPDLESYYVPSVTDIPIGNEHHVVTVHECNCPPPSIRFYECEHPSSNFLPLVSSLGKNLWALIQLIATSAAPFLIPLLAIKLIIVPLKILKLIKLFVKIFIILPFFLRVIYPALSNSFNLQDLVPSHSLHNHQHQHVHPHDVDSRSGNSTFRREDYVDENSMWDLRSCPSRVSCEFGAFLATSTYDNFPHNLAVFLARKADRVVARSAGDGNHEEEEDGENNGELDRIKRNAAFKAFLIALGKRWTQDMCEIYKCPLLF